MTAVMTRATSHRCVCARTRACMCPPSSGWWTPGQTLLEAASSSQNFAESFEWRPPGGGVVSVMRPHGGRSRQTLFFGTQFCVYTRIKTHMYILIIIISLNMQKPKDDGFSSLYTSTYIVCIFYSYKFRTWYIFSLFEVLWQQLSFIRYDLNAEELLKYAARWYWTSNLADARSSLLIHGKKKTTFIQWHFSTESFHSDKLSAQRQINNLFGCSCIISNINNTSKQ